MIFQNHVAEKIFQNLRVRLKFNTRSALKIKLFVAREIQYFELGIFSFNSYVYYLTRGFIASTRAFNLLARAFNLPTRAFNLATRAFIVLTREFELVTRRSELVTRKFELVTHGFELVTRGFELITRGFELATRKFELVTRRFELVTRNSCFTFPLSYLLISFFLIFLMKLHYLRNDSLIFAEISLLLVFRPKKPQNRALSFCPRCSRPVRLWRIPEIPMSQKSVQ